jgi:UDP-N-acetylmuramoylalanine--D-glutamate ligase
MRTKTNELKGKQVLVLGLGALGGGIATTCWLLEQGALVTVTDLKNEEQLASSVRRVEEHLKRTAVDGKAYAKIRARLTWALGGHSNALVDESDMVVVNPDVPARSTYVQRALKRGIAVANEGILFYDHWSKPCIGVTGTRGKTTTAAWTNHLIGTSLLTGNSIVKPFTVALSDATRKTAAVTELSSFILELFDHAHRAPHIAIITNLYRDHLNRHGTMKEYAQAKSNIFRRQTPDDILILNADDDWTAWFEGQKPAASLRYTSMHTLPTGSVGLWYRDGGVWEWRGLREHRVLEVPGFAGQWGEHNLANLLQAALAAHEMGVSFSRIQTRIAGLPSVQYRQEIVHRDAKLTVINDTTATSPEAGVAAMRRWGGPTCILITGGTDRELDYRLWARELPKHIRRTNTIFLSGSATQKMRAALKADGTGIRAYDTLEAAWEAALERAGTYVSAVILFSPSAKSFEMFANEYDRGQQFNALVHQPRSRRR